VVIEHVHPEGEPTPTLQDLYERKEGLVEVVDWATPKGKPTHPSKFRLTEKGQAELGRIMRANAAASLARGTEKEEGVERVRRAAENAEGGGGNGRKSAWTPA